MEFLVILLIGAVTFGICFLLDKGFTGIFRGKTQHKTGLSVRLSQHYGSAGLILALLGGLSVYFGWSSSRLLVFCGGFVVVLGVALVVRYLSFGIYYDGTSFILSTFGKKSKTYSFAQIRGQKLYQVMGGNTIIELYLEDGRSVSLQSDMKGAYPFLDAAFAGWRRQKDIREEDCPWHDPRNSCWFPSVEE